MSNDNYKNNGDWQLQLQPQLQKQRQPTLHDETVKDGPPGSCNGNGKKI